MIKFVEYIDDKIRIKLPKQLKQNRSQRFFRGNLVRGKSESNMMVGVSIDLNEEQRKVYLEPEKRQPVVLPAGYKVLRSGPCDFGEGGREFFSSSEIFGKGYTLYTWEVIYCLQGRYVMLSIMGGGTRESFESMAIEIIKSLTLLSPSQAKKLRGTAGSSKIKSVKFGSMQAKDKSRLSRELKSLPEELRYLREPILAIADEDQELLGSGVVDTPLLAEAIEKQAASQPSDFASDHAGQLRKWLKGITKTDEPWIGPVWFVMAFLVGYDVYKDEGAESSVQSLTKVVNRLLDMDSKF